MNEQTPQETAPAIPATYREIAHLARLSGNRVALYIRYMQTRWPDTETQKCKDGYAAEWAARFTDGREYAASDVEGQSILRTLREDIGEA